MAQPRTWLPRAAEIAEVLRKMKSRDLDRSAIEELFQLQRRAAITLMRQAGAKGERGEAWMVPRDSLLTWVERTAQNESWQLERRRHTSEELSQSMAEVQAIRAALNQAGKKAISFPIVEEVLTASCASLPPNIVISPGCITIRLSGPDPTIEACQLLYRLGLALANDFDGFTSLVMLSKVS